MIFLLPVLLLNEGVRAQSYLNTGRDTASSSGLRIISDSDDGLMLHYKSGSREFEKLSPDEGRFVRLRIPDHSYSSAPGEPELPVLTRLIDYDRARDARIIISNIITVRQYLSELGDYDRIIPTQPGQAKTKKPQDTLFVLDKSVYSADHPLLTDTVKIEKIGIMRGKTIGRLEVNPVIYNPSDKYVDIIVSMDIFIDYTTEYIPSRAIKGRSDFDKLLSKGLINYNPDDVIPSFSLEPSGLIIVSDTLFKKHLKPLVRWKTQKGMKVTEIYIGENGLEKNFADIKDTLTYIFNNGTVENPAPTYLILAGDINYIPPSQGTNYLTDMYYAEFDGNGDFIPDMFTGRLPARDTSQMKAIVNKIIEYESFMFADTVSHIRKAVAVTGYDEGHVSFMDGQVNYAADYFNENPNSTESYVFNHQLNDSIRTVRYDSLKTLMKNGVGFINYSGHGSSSSWLDTGIDYTFPGIMTNESKYPLIISNACLTAKYNDLNCLGTRLVRAIDKGALAFIGCTNDSYWTEDYYWAVGVGPIVWNPSYENSGLGFYDRLFHLNGEKPSEWYTTTGEILYAGNLSVSSSTSPRKQYYWENYVLLGDPSITPFIGKADTISVSVPDNLPPGLKTLNLITEEFAYAGLSDFDTLWDARHATPDGSISLEIPDAEKDSCLLVLTRQNARPFIKTVYFAESDTAWLSVNDIIVSDITGNDNGKADYGETISLKVDLQNAGKQAAENVYVKISSDSDYLTIISDSLNIGTLGAKTEIIETGFSISIADSIPDLNITSLDIEIHHTGSTIMHTADISLHAPDLVIINSIADDSATGNGNGLAEPGERVNIVIRVKNLGSSACSGNMNISDISEYIDFDLTSIPTGLLSPDVVSDIIIPAEISMDTPESYEITFTAAVSCGPYLATNTLSVVAGKQTEDFELMNFTTFPWITDSENPWIITDQDSRSNMYSARSGNITHNEKSVLSMLLNMPEDDSLRFWYKVSSEESWDSLSFSVDEDIILIESGEADWTEAIIPLSEGVHLLEWKYEKDQSVNNGYDCAYIDLVRFPDMSFIQSALKLNKISSPVEGKSYSEEVISVDINNLGRDTVRTISMTYIINSNQPVNETFNTEIMPGDSLTLSFTQTYDMSAEDTYFIRVFATYPDNHFINDTLKATIVSTGFIEPEPEKDGFMIAPNPIRDHINIISNIDSEDNTLIIFNQQGAAIMKEEIQFISAGQEISLKPGSLAGGTYILLIQTGTKRYRYKFIKL